VASIFTEKKLQLTDLSRMTDELLHSYGVTKVEVFVLDVITNRKVIGLKYLMLPSICKFRDPISVAVWPVQ
jgi:hypothetical protein